MEQVVVLILFVVASIVSSVLQNRKKRQEAEERGGLGKDHPEQQQPPLSQWPRTAKDWQDELRRLLDEHAPEKPVPPIVVPQYRPKPSAPVVPAPAPIAAEPREISEGELELASRLKVSDQAYARASTLHERVQDRMRAIDRATVTHKKQAGIKTQTVAQRWAIQMRSPQGAREAFLASIVFAPPLSLQPPDKTAGAVSS